MSMIMIVLVVIEDLATCQWQGNMCNTHCVSGEKITLWQSNSFAGECWSWLLIVSCNSFFPRRFSFSFENRMLLEGITVRQCQILGGEESPQNVDPDWERERELQQHFLSQIFLLGDLINQSGDLIRWKCKWGPDQPGPNCAHNFATVQVVGRQAENLNPYLIFYTYISSLKPFQTPCWQNVNLSSFLPMHIAHFDYAALLRASFCRKFSHFLITMTQYGLGSHPWLVKWQSHLFSLHPSCPLSGWDDPPPPPRCPPPPPSPPSCSLSGSQMILLWAANSLFLLLP